jgi:hypothetical protein
MSISSTIVKTILLFVVIFYFPHSLLYVFNLFLVRERFLIFCMVGLWF